MTDDFVQPELDAHAASQNALDSSDQDDHAAGSVSSAGRTRAAGPGSRSGSARKSKTTPKRTSDSPRTPDEVHRFVFPGGKTAKEKAALADAGELPPISDVGDMFTDLVGAIPRIAEVARRLRGRKLRVATMCSGTESPLLALEQISRAVKKLFGIQLEIKHVFSCEIEPFKQAYIERNFAPPILFRDVCELGNDMATTAYGALVPVPSDVDMLVAGTSCVDYSNLNNEKQDLDAHGESGRTFRGMMSWVSKHRPPIVILENVCSAPWDRVKKRFEKQKYRAEFMRVDTKSYYIPHTRTRVYLFATTAKVDEMPAAWRKEVMALSRPSSSPLEAFLLPSDDPRIHRAREDLARPGKRDERKTGRTDWGRCESRHQRARLEENLGFKRPLTAWEEGSMCKLPDFAWNDWGLAQTERVLDLMDINYLRLASKGVDACFKTLVWNLSQNVDRSTGSVRPGICPCLTPSMIPYITNRGGPLVGLEALSLQGIPVDELLLTRESEDQLADLAGNAMTTTVVGACMLAALTVAAETLAKGPGASEEVDPDVKRTGHIIEMKQLADHSVDLTSCAEVQVARILADAERSSRQCECEGRSGTTTKKIRSCVKCGKTSCVSCGGRPEHDYVESTTERLPPAEFEAVLKTALPMMLTVEGINHDVLGALRDAAGDDIDEDRWVTWKQAVGEALSDLEFRFRGLKRQEIWSVTYDTPKAVLELLLDPREPEWRLYVKPPADAPVKAMIRAVLADPVARMRLDTEVHSLLEGQWEVCLPILRQFNITITGCGEQVTSWERELGLGGEFEKKRCWSQLRISGVPVDVKYLLDGDITGTYDRLSKCGTAMSSLHKKSVGPEEEGSKGLPPFFFLDPTRCGEVHDDFLVFSTNIRQLGYADRRPLIARLDRPWRPYVQEGENATTGEPRTVSCRVENRWVKVDGATLKPAITPAICSVAAKYAMPAGPIKASCHIEACKTAVSLLRCSVPLTYAERVWPDMGRDEIDLLHKGRSTFEALAWILERLPPLSALESWAYTGEELTVNDLKHVGKRTFCDRCAPSPPDIQWVASSRKVLGLEDPIQAGAYEQALKSRPPPFVVQLERDGSRGTLEIGLNIASLIHRALSRLPIEDTTSTLKPRLSWRLTSIHAETAVTPLRLTSNKCDALHTQPPHFKKYPLRPEQLRSLTWMVEQERPDAPPFVEEEVSEAVLGPLGWRAEGRAERSVLIRGGVLADEVGYGKTAITIGLISARHADAPTETAEVPHDPSIIPIKATLVVVPSHLTKQWPTEIKKFTGSSFGVLTISSLADLNGKTISDFEKADVVVVSSSLFRSDIYWANLASLAAKGPLPARGGRHFVARYKETIAGLRERVAELTTLGTDCVARILEAAEDARRRHEETAAEPSILPMKRLVGKQYKAAVCSPSTKCTKEEKSTPKAAALAKPAPKKTTKKTPRKAPASSNRKRKSHHVDSSEEGDLSGQENMHEDSLTSKRPTRSCAKRAKKYVFDTDEDDNGKDADEDYEQGDEADNESDEDVDDEGEMDCEEEEDEEEQDDDDDDDDDGDVDGLTREAKIDDVIDKPRKIVAKKLARSERDPWKLGSAVVKKNWKNMRCPPLEIFHFRRIVVDEFTYLEGREQTAITGLKSDLHWVLSGTPPVHDFAAVKSIAVFLKVHLGVDDDSGGVSADVAKKLRREKTDAEKFHSFREIHTAAWHARRHQVAQSFLDRFVRQNIAEIDEIPSDVHIKSIVLPAAERALYLELEHHLQAIEMNTKKSIKSKNKGYGDRERRLQQALGQSKSAEEALLKRCSHFDLDLLPTSGVTRKGAKSTARVACKAIVAERQRQLDDCKAELLKCISEARLLHATILKNGGYGDPNADRFSTWKANAQSAEVGDAGARAEIALLLAAAGCIPKATCKPPVELLSYSLSPLQPPMASGNRSLEGKARCEVVIERKRPCAENSSILNAQTAKSSEGEGASFTAGNTDRTKPILPTSKFGADTPKAKSSPSAEKSKKTKLDDDGFAAGKIPKGQTIEDVIWDLRERTHVLRKLEKELVGRVRSLRYFTMVRDLQQTRVDFGGLKEVELACPGKFCRKKRQAGQEARRRIPADDVAILSSCGHMGCRECVNFHACKQECVEHEESGCRAPARETNVVLAVSLGVDADTDKIRQFGAKLSAVVDLIQSVPPDERILIFVQFPDLMQKVAEALDDANVRYLQIKGTAHAKSTALQKFQREDLPPGGERVLLLNVMDESASGANLTVANHAIFISPLLAPTQEIYNACETQAVGRVRRYGQRKTVHIYRLLTENTMDTQIYNQRVQVKEN